MSESNITKLALADSLKELMAKKSFAKISVGEIVLNCGLTRQAFYYHFQDKFDLMNWIYYTETARIMSAISDDREIQHWADGLIELCIYMQDNKTFYVNALNTTGQNSFQEYLHDYIHDMLKSMIESIVKKEFTEEKWGFLCELVATSYVALIVRWANDGMREDPTDYVKRVNEIFDGSVLHELEARKNLSG